MSESEKRSPVLAVGVALALVLGLVLLLRRSADTSAVPTNVGGDAAPFPSFPSPASPSAPPVVDLASARKLVSAFVHEAELAHHAELLDAAGRLDKALAKDDCVAARQPYDAIKETKVDLTTQTTLVLSQIRMLTSVGAYCNSWSGESGKRW
jgi:hypothetical protein